MTNLLVIDIGNTNITLGIYQDSVLRAHWRVATDDRRTSDEYGLQLLALLQHAGYGSSSLTGVCLASVVPPLTQPLSLACESYLGIIPFRVDPHTPTGIAIRIPNPSQVGADRIVDAVAVRNLYSVPACVVDFGTATTFDAIDRNGDYVGGAIAPGIGIAADALYQRTAKLPRVEIVRPPRAIGENTVQAMQSGLLFGYVGLVEGMVARFRAELGADMRVIGTGGLATLIAQETDVLDVIDPWLTLAGLRIIWEMNHPRDGQSTQ